MSNKKQKKLLKEQKKKENRQRFSLTLFFSVIVFCVLLAAIALAGVILFILIITGVIGDVESVFTATRIGLIMAGASLILGFAVSMLLLKVPLRPVNDLINRTNRLASGDYKARLSYKGMIGNIPGFNELSDSFNKLAAELESTEILRSDFINNFSHEFKTPIVSIAGFAKLLKQGQLSEEERLQYLSAIEEESMRLSYMATNVLNLTKVENQTILSNVSDFNLSELVRSAILLLASKWEKKELDWQLELEEYTVTGSEELLKEVFINLIDNAVKFSPAGETIRVLGEHTDSHIKITIINKGPIIPPEKQQKIWRKFYQADESHSSEGNGIGLAIVKRIITLHQGEVGVSSDATGTAFFVSLPQKT